MFKVYNAKETLAQSHVRLLTAVFGSQRRVHPPIHSGGVLSIIITANSSLAKSIQAYT